MNILRLVFVGLYILSFSFQVKAQQNNYVPYDILIQIPKHGYFTLNHESHITGEKVISNNYVLKGQMFREAPNGNWQYSIENFQAEDIKVFKSKITANTFGTETKSSFEFDKGVPKGIFKFSKDSFVNTKSVGNISAFQSGFQKGVLHGNFEYKADKLTIKGQLKEGFYDGKWTWLSDKDTLVFAVYDKGVLMSFMDKVNNLKIDNSFLVSENKSSNIKISKESFGVAFFQSTDVLNDEKYAQFLYQLGDLITLIYQPIASINKREIDYYINTGFTKAIYYNLSNKEQKDLNEMEITLSEINRISDSLTHEPLLRLSQYHDKELAEFYKLLSFSEQESQKWLEFLNYVKSDQARLFSFKKIVEKHDSLALVFINFYQNREENANSKFEDSKGIQQLMNILDIWYANIQKGLVYFENKKSFLKNMDELESIENQMLDNVEIFKTEINENFTKDSLKPSNKLLKLWSDSTLHLLVSDYAQIESIDERKKQVEHITLLCNTIKNEKRLIFIDSIPEKMYRAYNYNVYNPYTGANDIPVKKKQKFYSAASQLGFEFGLTNLASSSGAEEWNMNIEKLLLFHQKMLKIAEQSEWKSRNIERRVRKEKEAEKIYKWIKNY